MGVYMLSGITLLFLLLHIADSQNSHHLSCRQCLGYHDRTKCVEKQCPDHNMICSARAVQFPDGIKYYEACVYTSLCNHHYDLTAQNIHGGNQLCAKCCHHSGCNRDLCHQSEHRYGETTTQVPTTVQTLTTPSCVTCFDVESFDKCTGIEKCLPGEQCSVMVTEDKAGHKHVYAGCEPHHSNANECHINTNPRPSDQSIMCHHCCDTDLCNSNVCSYTTKSPTTTTTPARTTTTPTQAFTTVTSPTTPTTPAPTTTAATTLPMTRIHPPVTNAVTTERSPITCLLCLNVSSISDCTKTEVCHHTQMCSLYVVRLGNKIAFEGGCVSAESCDAQGQLLFNFENEDMLCGQCCEDDNCNKHVCTEYSKLNPIECDVCKGNKCGVTPVTDPVMTCPTSKSYCITTVQNKGTLDRTVTKGCAAKTDCNSKWWESPVCISFRSTGNYSFPFTCSYCCTTPRCNTQLYPYTPNLYTGSSTNTIIG